MNREICGGELGEMGLNRAIWRKGEMLRKYEKCVNNSKDILIFIDLVEYQRVFN